MTVANLNRSIDVQSCRLCASLEHQTAARLKAVMQTILIPIAYWV